MTAEIQHQAPPGAAGLDQRAVAELYSAHAAAAQRAAYAVTRNGPDAEDATSEAFVRILTALAAERLGSNILWGPYLLTASRNAAVDLVRGSSRTWSTERHDDLDREAEAPLPGDGLLAQADAVLVLQAFRDLPRRHRLVLVLVEVDGRSLRQAGAALGLSPNATAQLAVRARAGLRSRFIQAGGISDR